LRWSQGVGESSSKIIDQVLLLLLLLLANRDKWDGSLVLEMGSWEVVSASQEGENEVLDWSAVVGVLESLSQIAAHGVLQLNASEELQLDLEDLGLNTAWDGGRFSAGQVTWRLSWGEVVAWSEG
jgi:hypothetical protein